MNSIEHRLTRNVSDLYALLYGRWVGFGGWIKARDILGDNKPSSSAQHVQLRDRMRALRAELLVINSDQMVVSNTKGYKLTDNQDEILEWLRIQDSQARIRYQLSNRVRRNLKQRNPRQEELF